MCVNFTKLLSFISLLFLVLQSVHLAQSTIIENDPSKWPISQDYLVFCQLPASVIMCVLASRFCQSLSMN